MVIPNALPGEEEDEAKGKTIARKSSASSHVEEHNKVGWCDTWWTELARFSWCASAASDTAAAALILATRLTLPPFFILRSEDQRVRKPSPEKKYSSGSKQELDAARHSVTTTDFCMASCSSHVASSRDRKLRCTVRCTWYGRKHTRKVTRTMAIIRMALELAPCCRRAELLRDSRARIIPA
ncbi:hypothetical protein EYF80_042062 [Liparis tanakae]|uniref:Uncharacterized protein n=1 Tax=Liparis tanakae TaxID=230148 RepID=A0A4Z2G4C9_9TELE|nr:hypothetical protein EYF80_042062 [Liparis tanakae]